MGVVHVPKGQALVETAAEKAIYAKINLRIIPLLLVAYIFAFIDRVNIGFAQLQMKSDLHLSSEVSALGAGLFFVGYFLFEVPSNLLLEKIGARKTILRIMICWGACATAMAWVSSPWQFYVLRFLLGAFEAGFFPGVILYFTYWYPSARRGRTIATFMTATALAGVLVGPLNGALLKFGNGFIGMHGWQWMFIANGAPCLIIAAFVYFLLADTPSQAKWLTAEEKKIVTDRVEGEKATLGNSHHSPLRDLVSDPKVWVLCLIYFLMLGAVYALIFSMPSLVQSWGVKDLFTIGWLQAIPSMVGVVGMILIGRSSDRTGDRRWHYVFTIGLIAFGLTGIAVMAPSLAMSIALLSIATIGTSTATPLFFTFVSEYLPKETAAGGIAFVSSLGNIGPSITPSIFTWVVGMGGSAYGLMLVVVMYSVAGVIMAVVGRARRSAAAEVQYA